MRYKSLEKTCVLTEDGKSTRFPNSTANKWTSRFDWNCDSGTGSAYETINDT